MAVLHLPFFLLLFTASQLEGAVSADPENSGDSGKDSDKDKGKAKDNRNCVFGLAQVGDAQHTEADPNNKENIQAPALNCRRLMVKTPAKDVKCKGLQSGADGGWQSLQVHAVKYVPRPIGVTRKSDVYTPPYKFIYERDIRAMSLSLRANAVRLDPWDIKADHTDFLEVCKGQGISVIPTFDLATYLDEDYPASGGALRQTLGKDFEEFLSQADKLEDQGDKGPIIAWSVNYGLNVGSEVKLGELSGDLESPKRRNFFAALCYLRHVHKKKEWDNETKVYKRPLAIPLNLNSASSLEDIGWYTAFAETTWGSWPDCPYWENSPTHSEGRGALRQLGAFDIWILEGMYLAKNSSRDLAIRQAAQVNASLEIFVDGTAATDDDKSNKANDDGTGGGAMATDDEDNENSENGDPEAGSGGSGGPSAQARSARSLGRASSGASALMLAGDQPGGSGEPKPGSSQRGPQQPPSGKVATVGTMNWPDLLKRTNKDADGTSICESDGRNRSSCYYPTRKAVLMQFGFSARVTFIGEEGTINVQADAGEQMTQLQAFWSELNDQLQSNDKLGGSCVFGGILDEWMDDWDRSSSLGCDSNPYEHSLDQRCTVDPGQGQIYPEWLGINAQYSSYGLQCVAPRAPHPGGQPKWFCFTDQDSSIADDLCNWDQHDMADWLVSEEKLIRWPKACRFYGVQVPILGFTIPMTWALSLWTFLVCMLPTIRGLHHAYRKSGCRCRKEQAIAAPVQETPSQAGGPAEAPEAPLAKQTASVEVDVPKLLHIGQAPTKFIFRLDYLPERKSHQGIKKLSKDLGKAHLQLHVETQARRLWQQIEAEAWAVEHQERVNAQAQLTTHGEHAELGSLPAAQDHGKIYLKALSHIYARVMEGYIVWVEENSKKRKKKPRPFDKERLEALTTLTNPEAEDYRNPGYLYIDALLLRTVESVAEQALHAPEYLCWHYHQIRDPTWQNQHEKKDLELGGNTIFTIDYDALHEGIERICEQPDPYSGGLNFDDINDNAHYDEPELKLRKVFFESSSLWVLFDCFSNFQAVFTLKSWVLYLAWILWHALSKRRGTAIEVEWNELFFTITTVDSIFVTAGEAMTMLNGWQQGRFWAWKFARMRWILRHSLAFLNGCIGVLACFDGTRLFKVEGWSGKVWPFFSKEDSDLLSTALFLSYWFLRFVLCAIFLLGFRWDGRLTPHRPGRPEGQGGGKSLREARTSWGVRGGVWIMMILMCLFFETVLVVPMAYGIRFKDFCRDSCYQVVGAGDRNEKGFMEFMTSSCLSCTGALGMVWCIVLLTAFFDIYYMFYLGTALIGYFEGHNAGLTNILQSAHRRLDLMFFKQKESDDVEATTQESDAAFMSTLYGPSWRRVWSRIAESLHEENMISDADANLLVKNAGTARWKAYSDPAVRAKMVMPEDVFDQVSFVPKARRNGPLPNSNEWSVVKCIQSIKILDDQDQEFTFSEKKRTFIEEVDGSITVHMDSPCKVKKFSFQTAAATGGNREMKDPSIDRDPTQFRLEGQNVAGDLQLLLLELGPVKPHFSEPGATGSSDHNAKTPWTPTEQRGAWMDFADLQEHEAIKSVRFTPLMRRMWGEPCISQLIVRGEAQDGQAKTDRADLPRTFQTATSERCHVAPDGTITLRLEQPLKLRDFEFSVDKDYQATDPTQWALNARQPSGEWKELYLQNAPYVPNHANQESFTIEFWRTAGPEGLGKSMALEELRGKGALERLTFFLSTLERLARDEQTSEGLLSGHHGTIPSLTQILPCYNETVILDAKSLRDSDGVNTNLAFIISQYKYEWKIFCERQKCSVEELYDDFINHCPADRRISDKTEMQVQMWASMRSQTVARTVVGAMRYHEVLELVPSVEDPIEEYKGPTPQQEEFRGRHACLAQLIVAHQTFGKLKSKGGDPANDKAIMYLLELYKRYPIYVVFDYDAGGAQEDIKKMVAAKIGGNLDVKYASVMARFRRGQQPMMVEEVRNMYKDIELVEILPRCYPLRIGKGNFQTQGKAGNQLGALRFSAGHYLQMMDCNMGAFFGEAAKVPFVLRKFQPSQNRHTVAFRIFGFRELIFTKDHGAMGSIMAAAEWSFGTICQRFLAGLDARMHYGHPDFIDGFWASNRGSLSKASPVINLSEDIFAGFNARMRGERSSHTDALAWEKGREASFNASSDFFRKVSCGNVGVMRSRDLKILTDRLSLIDNLSFYFASIGFYLNNWLIDISMFAYVLLFVLLAFASKDLDSIGQLGSMLAVEWVISMGTVSMLPRLAEMVLEYGYFEGILNFIPSVPGIMLAFTFINKSIAAGIGESMVTGQASYISTGRPNANTHFSWRDCYFSHSSTHYYPAMTICFLFGLYTAIASERGTASLPMFVILGTASLWLTAPLLFCPQPTLKSMKRDGKEFWKFVVAAPLLRQSMRFFRNNKTLEETLITKPDKNQQARQPSLYEVWLEKALDHKKSSIWMHIAVVIKEFFLLLLLGGLVHARVFDALMSLFRYFAIHCVILELWRMSNRPEILIFLAFFVALPLPLILRRHEPSNILVAFMLLRVFMSWAEKSILFCVRVFLGRCWASPDPKWPSMPGKTEEEIAAKARAAELDRNYNKVVEYLYVSFMTYELHLVRGLFILAINCSVQSVLVFVEALCGLHSQLLLNKHLGLRLGVLGSRKSFRPSTSSDFWDRKPPPLPPLDPKKDPRLRKRKSASVEKQDSDNSQSVSLKPSSFRRLFSRGASNTLDSSGGGVSLEMSELPDRIPSSTRGPVSQSFAGGRPSDLTSSGRLSLLSFSGTGRVQATRTIFSREG